MTQLNLIKYMTQAGWVGFSLLGPVILDLGLSKFKGIRVLLIIHALIMEWV